MNNNIGLKGIKANEVGNEIDNNISNEEIMGLAERAQSHNEMLYSDKSVIQNDYLLHTPELGVHRLPNDGSTLSTYGSSKYDNEILFNADDDTVRDHRFEKQGALAQLGVGLAKGAIIAGTTFVDGVAMWTYGIGKGIANKLDNNSNTNFIDGVWNNEITKTMESINEWAEDTFKSYYSTAQENSPWYSANNIFSANFLGDKILKNMGFMVGAFASGSILTAAKLLPKALGVLTKSAKIAKSAAALEGSLVSAVSEGGIEALNNSTEWEKAQIEKLNTNYQQELESLEKMRYALTPDEYNARITRLNLTRENTLQKIQEDKIKMGNIDMLLNLPILTAENMFAWGKLYSSGFKDATRFGKFGKNIKVNKENGALKSIENATKKPMSAAIKETTGRSIGEGLEEINQATAEQYAGLREEQDVNNYYKAALNGTAYEETYDKWKAAVEAIKNTYGNGDRWEEFAIGALSSVFGMPRIRGVKNKTTDKFQSPITFEGGILQNWQDAKKEEGETQELVDNINKRLADPKFKKQFEGLTAHEYYQKIMDESAQEGNKKDFKDAEAKQFVNDVFMFHKAGLLNNVESIIETAGDLSNLKFDEKGNLLQGNENSEEDKNNFDLIKENDKVKDENDKYIRSQRGWFNIQDGVDTQIKTDKEIVDDISNRKNKILDYIDTYKKTIENIDYDTNGIFSDDQLTQLAWVKMNRFSDHKRMGDILNGIRDSEDVKKPSVKRIKGVIDGDIKSLRARKDLSEDEYKQLEKLEEYSKRLEEFIDTDFSDYNDKSERDYKNLYEDVSKAIRYLAYNEYTDENIQAVREELDDVTRLGIDAGKYNKLYNEYLQNPGLLEDQIKEVRNKARVEQVEKKASEIESKLAEAKEFKDFWNIYKNEIEFLKQFDAENIDDNVALLENKLRNSKNSMVSDYIKKIDIAKKRESAYEKVKSDIFNAEDLSELSEDTANKISNLSEDQSFDLENVLEKFFSVIEDGHSLDELKTFADAALKAYEGHTTFPTEILNDIVKLVLDKFEQIEATTKANETSETNGTDITSPDDDPDGFGPGNFPGNETPSAGTSTTPSSTPAPQPPLVSDKKENEKDFIDKLNDIPLEDLNKLTNLDGSVSNDTAKQLYEFIKGLPAGDQNKWKKIITDKIKEIALPTDNNGMTPDQETAAQNQGIKDGIDKLQENETIGNDSNGTPFVKSWIATFFNFDDLKQRVKTLFGATDPSTEFLQKNGGQDFVDRGNLATLDELYRKSHNGKPLPIHFVTIAGQDRFNKVKKRNTRIIYLGVELTDDVKDLLNNNRIDSTVTSTVAENRNFILVGACGIYKYNKQSGYNYNIIENLINAEGGLNVDSTSNFVSKNTTEIQNYYSGRFYSKDLTVDPEIKSDERYLKNTGVPSFSNPNQVLIGVYSNNRISCPALGLETPIVQLNTNNPINRNGSVWLIIRGADGRYYPTGLKVRRFNKTECNLDVADNATLLIVQKIKECVEKIVDPDLNITTRLDAKYQLEKYLGFPSVSGKTINPIVIGSDATHSREVISINVLNGMRKNDIMYENGHYIEDKDLRVKAFMNALLDCNYRFQVKLSELNGDNYEEYTKLLLNSNILSTNLISDYNVCGSFEIKSLDANGKILNAGTAATTTYGESKVDNSSIIKSHQFSIDGVSLKVEYSDGGIIKTENLTEDQTNAAKFIYHLMNENVLPSEYVAAGEHQNLKIYKPSDANLVDKVIAVKVGGNVFEIYTPKNLNYKTYNDIFINQTSSTPTAAAVDIAQSSALDAAGKAIGDQNVVPLSDSEKAAKRMMDSAINKTNAVEQMIVTNIETTEGGELVAEEPSGITFHDVYQNVISKDRELSLRLYQTTKLDDLNSLMNEFNCKYGTNYKFKINKNTPPSTEGTSIPIIPTTPTNSSTSSSTLNPQRIDLNDNYSSVEDDPF